MISMKITELVQEINNNDNEENLLLNKFPQS
jgi:hypothetical protein